MSHFGYPVVYALFVWWFSTGLIIYLDGLPTRTFRWSMLGATAVLAASLYGLSAHSADTTTSGAYAAFTFTLLAWGWQEISFYMGYVTGPRTSPSSATCTGWKHFGQAIETTIYHEASIIATAAVIVALTWGQPNQVGTWSFMVLWGMHESARLNVFLGVPNLNEQFLPEHMRYLESFLAKKPMNLLFPVSITVGTILVVVLAQRALAPGVSPFDAVRFTLLGTLMLLALLEHWFLVLPLPAASLWSWSVRTPVKPRAHDPAITDPEPTSAHPRHGEPPPCAAPVTA